MSFLYIIPAAPPGGAGVGAHPGQLEQAGAEALADGVQTEQDATNCNARQTLRIVNIHEDCS